MAGTDKLCKKYTWRQQKVLRSEAPPLRGTSPCSSSGCSKRGRLRGLLLLLLSFPFWRRCAGLLVRFLLNWEPSLCLAPCVCLCVTFCRWRCSPFTLSLCIPLRLCRSSTYSGSFAAAAAAASAAAAAVTFFLHFWHKDSGPPAHCFARKVSTCERWGKWYTSESPIEIVNTQAYARNFSGIR